MEKEQFLQWMVMGKLDSDIKENETDIGLEKDSLDLTALSKATKEKVNK